MVRGVIKQSQMLQCTMHQDLQSELTLEMDGHSISCTSCSTPCEKQPIACEACVQWSGFYLIMLIAIVIDTSATSFMILHRRAF